MNIRRSERALQRNARALQHTREKKTIKILSLSLSLYFFSPGSATSATKRRDESVAASGRCCTASTRFAWLTRAVGGNTRSTSASHTAGSYACKAKLAEVKSNSCYFEFFFCMVSAVLNTLRWAESTLPQTTAYRPTGTGADGLRGRLFASAKACRWRFSCACTSVRGTQPPFFPTQCNRRNQKKKYEHLLSMPPQPPPRYFFFFFSFFFSFSFLFLFFHPLPTWLS
jgi:hypothetical protein